MTWDNRYPLGEIYDWDEFTLSNGQTNYDVKANRVNLFSNIKIARKIVIETTRNITARFNIATFPAIKIDAGESPVEIKELITAKNIYLTNGSGSDATVRVLLI